MREEKTLTLNWDFCLKMALLVIFIYFLYLIKDLIIWIVFALVLSILFNFAIEFLERKRVPRILATVIVYFGLLILIGLFFYKTAPIFLAEINQFIEKLPEYLNKISPYLDKLGLGSIENSSSLFSFIRNNLQQVSQGIISALIVIFGGLQSTVFIVFLAFFFSLEKNLLENLLSNFIPLKYRERFLRLVPRVKRRVNNWFVSRIIGVIFVALLSYLVLRVFDVKYAFILAILGGILDFIPMLGPVVAGLLIAMIVMMSSVTKALIILICFIIIQQLEGNILFPVLFKKFVGLPPSLVLIALAVGASLWGFLGAILAIPLTGIIFEIIKDYLKVKKRKEASS